MPTTPPTGLLSPPDSTRKTIPIPAPPRKGTKVPPRLLDLTASGLRNLLQSSFPPERHIRIPNVSPDDLTTWESRQGFTRDDEIPERRFADPRSHGFTYTYNSITKSCIVRCMPTPYHTSVQRFFGSSAQNSLISTLGMDMFRTSRGGGLLIGISSDITGFKGVEGLGLGGTKIPDFAIKARGTKFPAVAMECGFSEDWADLLSDAELLLTGTNGQTKLVILVKLKERFPVAGDASDENEDNDEEENDDERDSNAPRPRAPGKHDWPTGFDPPGLIRGPGQDAREHQRLLVQKSNELAKWLLDAHHHQRLGRYPLIGKITAMAHVYCCTEEAADLTSKLGISQATGEEDNEEEDAMSEAVPQITLIYRYTFMTDDHPTATPDPTATAPTSIATGTGPDSPSTLQIPLHLLFPTSRPPASLGPHHLASPITFDFAELADEVLATAEEMLDYRADHRAAVMVRKWKKQWDKARRNNETDLPVGGTKRRTGAGGNGEGQQAGEGGETMAGWKRQRRLDAEQTRNSGSGSGSGSGGNDDDGEGDSGDEEWTPDCD